MSAFLEHSAARFAVGDLDNSIKWSSGSGEIIKKFVNPKLTFSYKKIRIRKENNKFFVELARELFYEIKADFDKLSESKKYYQKMIDLYFKG